MSCPDDGHLIRLISGELEPPHAGEVQQHVDACPRCADTVEGLRSTWAALGTWSEEETAPNLWPALRSTLEIEVRRDAGWLPRTSPALVRAAASIVVALGLGWTAGRFAVPMGAAPPGSAEPAAVSPDELIEPLGLDELAYVSATGLRAALDMPEPDQPEDAP